jgi:hypothetical protein
MGTAQPTRASMIFMTVKTLAVQEICAGIGTLAEIDHRLTRCLVNKNLLTMISDRAMTGFTL